MFILETCSKTLRQLAKSNVSTGKSMSPQTLFHNAASNIIFAVLFGARYEYDDEFLKLFVRLYTENAKIVNGPWAMVRCQYYFYALCY